MACCLSSTKPLPEPLLTQFIDHTCTTRGDELIGLQSDSIPKVKVQQEVPKLVYLDKTHLSVLSVNYSNVNLHTYISATGWLFIHEMRVLDLNRTTSSMATRESFEDVLAMVLTKYDPGLILRQKQVEALERMWTLEKDMLVSLPTGYGKSVISHLCGRLLRAKLGVESGMTLVVVPLNIIQEDQMASLHRRSLSVCKLDIKGHATTVSEESDDYVFEKVSIFLLQAGLDFNSTYPT